MVLPDTEDVEPRFRCYARTFMVVLILPVICFTIWHLQSIWIDRYHPPTAHAMVDGLFGDASNRSAWGTFPCLSFMCINHSSPVMAVPMDLSSSMCRTDGLSEDLPQIEATIVPNSVLPTMTINMTMLTPCASEDGIRDLRSYFSFMVVVQGEMPECFVSVFENSGQCTGGVGKPIMLGGLHGMIAGVAFQKSINPKPQTVFWGLPGEEPPTQTTVTMEYRGGMPLLAADFNTADGMPYHGFAIQAFADFSGKVLEELPVSTVAQVISVISSMGGFFAITTMIYGFVFVRRTKVTHAERQRSELTIRRLPTTSTHKTPLLAEDDNTA